MPRVSIPIAHDSVVVGQQPPPLPCTTCGRTIGTREPISVQTQDGAMLQTTYYGLMRLLLGGLDTARVMHPKCDR